jgi:glyoxylase-like metal-dependent hydrolase (beta-lactamase superfamily II)
MTSTRVLVIDPAAAPDQIRAMLEKAGQVVDTYILTHGHIDHFSALEDLLRHFPAPVAMHAADARWAFSANNALPPFFNAPLKPVPTLPLPPDGQWWPDPQFRFSVMDTPGHTPGSVCLYFPELQALFSGDTLFAGAIGRTDFPGGDAPAMARSLRRIFTLPAGTAVYPGHGPATRLDQEAATNYYVRQVIQKNAGGPARRTGE